MNQEKVTWEQVLQKFKDIEKTIFEDNNEKEMDNFFKYLNENFKLENGFNKEQILKARDKVAQILVKIGQMKDELQERNASLVTNEKKLNNYFKASGLNKT